MNDHDRNAIPTAFGAEAAVEPFRPHAAKRALERYGVELSLADVQALARRCLKGEGFLEEHPDGAQRHTLVHDGRVLWVVYRPPGEGRPKDGLVITVTPPDLGSTMRTARHNTHHKLRRLGKSRRQRKH